ncbi:MAG: hypothetical protein JRD47_06815 [Deltaproteobacteria bacterium]|nr:hypothetical protein [Deltaproteobacteria bacterium]MBW2265316.1 hypothetical protein [Deltaproteobacteria bacterium]MBW2317619.1 hypothetical protein [Deltaproteobacteria bacterium]MBW2601622.1 hypothetical protein [Deltaproteobacteria bacterium]
MAKLKQDLQQVTKQLKALTKKTESLVKAVDKLDKQKAAKKSKATTKAKPKRKKAATRKAATRKATAKKATKKTTTKKKVSTGSPANQVLKIIKRSKKGVHVSALMQKTGFGEGSVRNIVYKATKAGEIKRTGRGVYAGT